MTTRPGLWVPVVVLMVVIYWLSSQPVLPAPPGFLTDKEIHAFAFGVLSALWYRALARARWQNVTAARGLVAAAAATLYGLFDEWHQSFVPGRSSELADLLADLIGAGCAAALVWAWSIIAARRSMRQAGTSR